MPKFNVLPSDMTLYCAAEPNGRLFPQGSEWPGDLWSDRPGGEIPGQQTTEQAMIDLVSVQEHAEGLQKQLESALHSAAQANADKEAAVAELEALKQGSADGAKALEDADETAKGLTEERDSARADAEAQRKRADGLDAELAEEKATVVRMAGELDAANQRAADAQAAKKPSKPDAAG